MSEWMTSGSTLGRFWQVVPIACLVGAVYAVCRYVYVKLWGRARPWGEEAARLALVCYGTGLANLVLTPANLWANIWSCLRSGHWDGGIHLLSGGFNFVPTVFEILAGRLTAGAWVREMLLVNVLMYVPLGFLLPLVTGKARGRGILIWAIAVPLAVELFQPLVGRSFDVDDLLCNFAGILLGYGAAAIIRALGFAGR